MSAVRRWSLFLRAVVVAVGILLLGVGAFRVGVIQDQRLALWPASGILDLETLQGPEPLSSLAVFAVVQVAIWTFLAYLFFVGLEAVRRSVSRRP